MKVIATNRRARHDYQIFEQYEAGIELRGSEVKSLKTKGCAMEESFARVENEEVLLYNLHIPEFEKSSYFKADPKRIRRLLLHRREIKKLIGTITQKGLTLIPLKIFINDRGWAKIDLGVARGRKTYDKRKKLKEDIEHKEIRRTLKKYRTHL